MSRTSRYKHIAEEHWKEIHAKKGDTEKGFKFDMDVCRQVFDAYDRDGSGYLEIPELTKLAEELWIKSHPNSPKLSRASKEVVIYGMS